MKAIFFDIDGTILNGKLQVSDSCVRAIELARENGCLCFINTGRTKCLVDKRSLGGIEFDGYLMGCGMNIEYRGETLLKKSLSKELSLEIINFLRENEIDAILEGDENDYCEAEGEFFTKKFEAYASKYKGWGFGSYADAVGKFGKLFAYTEKPEAMGKFFQRFSDRLEIIDREQGYYEMLLKGFSKATAMDFVCEYLNIPLSNTVAIGDSNNDLPMLEHAGTAIAMKNSSKEVIACADYITTDIDDDGVYNALRWIGVI